MVRFVSGWPVLAIRITRAPMSTLRYRGCQSFSRCIDHYQNSRFTGIWINRASNKLADLQAAAQLVSKYRVHIVTLLESGRSLAGHMELVIPATAIVQGVECFDAGICRNGFGNSETHAGIFYQRTALFQCAYSHRADTDEFCRDFGCD